MHIPDGFVSGPVNALGFAIAAGMVATAAVRTRGRLGDRQVPLLGMTAAFIFAAQMLNFPVAGGTSGHFLGATFAALLLGPWAACLVLALVLLVQCLLFADGGITALGTNIVNMGVVGVGVGWTVARLVAALRPGHRGAAVAGAAIGGWCAVIAAAAACALELILSGHPAVVVLPAMLGVHALIGVGEGMITAAALASIVAARPDLVSGLPRPYVQALP